MKRRNDLVSNSGTIYSVIYGQCSEQMKAELKTSQVFKYIDQEQTNCVQLLNELRAIAYEFESKKNIHVSMDSALKAYTNISQAKGESLPEFKDIFDATVKALEYHGGHLGESLRLIKHELVVLDEDPNIVTDNREKTEEEAAIVNAKELEGEKIKAAAFIHRANSHQYGQLIAELENSYTCGFSCSVCITILGLFFIKTGRL